MMLDTARGSEPDRSLTRSPHYLYRDRFAVVQIPLSFVALMLRFCSSIAHHTSRSQRRLRVKAITFTYRYASTNRTQGESFDGYDARRTF